MNKDRNRRPRRNRNARHNNQAAVDERVARSYIGKEIKARVISVPDGDGLHVSLPGRKRGTVRFYGVDAPELAQPYGRAAQKKLRSITDKNVLLLVEDVDHYGRMVCVVNNDRRFLQGESLNNRMVREGLAYPFTRFGVLDGSMEALDEARKHSRGVWNSSVQLEAPWDYRSRISDEESSPEQSLLIGIYVFLARIVLYAIMLGGLGYGAYALLKYLGVV